MKIYSKTIGYKGEEDDFVKVSELRELLEKRRKTHLKNADMSYNPDPDEGAACEDIELLAELDSSPRASPAGEGLKEKVTK